MQDPDRAAEREALAGLLDKSARHMVIVVLFLAAIAAVDLATGSLLADKRLDLVLLGGTALGLWGAYSIRGTARRIRAGEPSERPSAARWAALVASYAASLAFAAAVGYLIGGWVVAVVLVSVVIVLTAFTFVIGTRRGRRMRAEADGDHTRAPGA